MNKDEILELDGLKAMLLDHVHSKIVSYDLVLKDWDISGRKGHRQMSFTHELIVGLRDPDTKQVTKYRLSRDECVCFENGDLTLQLPKKAVTLEGA